MGILRALCTGSSLLGCPTPVQAWLWVRVVGAWRWPVGPQLSVAIATDFILSLSCETRETYLPWSRSLLRMEDVGCGMWDGDGASRPVREREGERETEGQPEVSCQKPLSYS